MSATIEQPPPAVSLRIAAGSLAIEVAGKVAVGAAEGFSLANGPTRRLLAITLEATRNAVEHAYAHTAAGPVEVSVGASGSGGSTGSAVSVSIRDFGSGCPFEPTGSRPPGLGLSVMSELSEALSIRSTKNGGTEVEAVLYAGEPPEPDDPRGGFAVAGEPLTSELSFADPTLTAPVLPRTMAAHAAASGASMAALERVLVEGRAIGRALRRGGGSSAVTIGCDDASQSIEIGIASASSEDLDAIREELDRPTLHASMPGGGVLVTLPLH